MSYILQQCMSNTKDQSKKKKNDMSENWCPMKNNIQPGKVYMEIMDNCMPIEIRGLKLNLIGHWTTEELIVNNIRYKVCQTWLMLKTKTPEEV
jgi:hypothetical protein